MQVHQKANESLRDYMQWFIKATLDIDNVPYTICLSALLHGLRPGYFLNDLLENPPQRHGIRLMTSQQALSYRRIFSHLRNDMTIGRAKNQSNKEGKKKRRNKRLATREGG